MRTYSRPSTSALVPGYNWRQFSKLHGLKKLRVIAKELSPDVAFLSPFKVYAEAKQFRSEHTQGKKRILVRTDEASRQYQAYVYDTMPREDFHTEGNTPRKLRAMLKAATPKKPTKRKARLIVHPTDPYSGIASGGNILVNENEPPILHTTYGRFIFHEKSGFVSASPTPKDAGVPTWTNAVVQNAEKVLRAALKTRQIQPKKTRSYEIRFVTWGNNPAVLELYDLREFRKPDTK